MKEPCGAFDEMRGVLASIRSSITAQVGLRECTFNIAESHFELAAIQNIEAPRK